MANFSRLTDISKVLPWAAQLVRDLTRQVRHVNFGTVTLNPGAAQTIVRNSFVQPGSYISLTPNTEAAATEHATLYIPRTLVVRGSFTIMHASSDVTDRRYSFVVFEPGGQST